tara:strand:- start:223 stop:477 length:255 start_codon:yes stop_codon:yes gene_type:complete
MLQKGEVDAILDDEQSMKATLSILPLKPRVIGSASVMPLFMAFAISKKFHQDPRSSSINDAIARSYYDGTYTDLSQHWLQGKRQ